MANEEQLAILKQGVKVWNEWRENNPFIEPDFKGAELSGADLTNADLRGANLVDSILKNTNLTNADITTRDLGNGYFGPAQLDGADLSGSELIHVRLRYASLVGVNFNKADIGDTNLVFSDLRRANLAESHLGEADFSSAKLDDAQFFNATIEFCKFNRTDLSQVRGLETISHRFPSSIGIDTIYKSGGNIPELFLRGCGVPENMITFMHSLAGQGKAFDFYSCFISYSSKDTNFTERLHADLQSKGVRVWFAPEDLKIGDKFRTRIDEAIKVYDKLLIVLSENSINSSWVEKEVETAFEKENREKRVVLFPIRLDDSVMETNQSWAADIRRQHHVGDFTGWKEHDKYQKAFERLMRDLKASEV